MRHNIGDKFKLQSFNSTIFTIYDIVYDDNYGHYLMKYSVEDMPDITGIECSERNLSHYFTPIDNRRKRIISEINDMNI